MAPLEQAHELFCQSAVCAFFASLPLGLFGIFDRSVETRQFGPAGAGSVPLGCIHTPANPPLCEGTIANERKFFTLYNALPPERRVMVANAVLEPTVMAPLKKGDAGLRWRGIKKAIESILWMELDLTLVVPLVQKFETFLWKHQEAITKEINRPRGRLSDQWTADTEREFERVYVYLTYCRMLAALEQHERVDSDRFRLKYWDSKAV